MGVDLRLVQVEDPGIEGLLPGAVEGGAQLERLEGSRFHLGGDLAGEDIRLVDHDLLDAFAIAGFEAVDHPLDWIVETGAEDHQVADEDARAEFHVPSFRE